MSDIVRQYIEQRFQVTATHRTTEEFLHDLLSSSNARWPRIAACSPTFFSQCDIAKFAAQWACRCRSWNRCIEAPAAS